MLKGKGKIVFEDEEIKVPTTEEEIEKALRRHVVSFLRRTANKIEMLKIVGIQDLESVVNDICLLQD